MLYHRATGTVAINPISVFSVDIKAQVGVL